MDNKILYAIIFKDSGEVLTPDSFKKYWPSYGNNNLYGWRPPKKVYYTLGKAKQGFSYVPESLKSQLVIAEFTMSKIVESGVDLRNKQEINRLKKEYKENISNLKYKIKNCKAELCRINSLTETLKQLESELKELT